MSVIDFNEAMRRAKTASFEPLPDNQYDMVCLEASAETTSTGKPMIKAKWQVESGPYAGKKVFDQYVFSADNDNALSFFFQHMRTFGLDEAWFSQAQSMEQIAVALPGRRCRMDVGTRIWEGQPRNDVKKILPPGAPNPTAPAAGAIPGMPPMQVPQPAMPGVPAPPMQQVPQPQVPVAPPQPAFPPQTTQGPQPVAPPPVAPQQPVALPQPQYVPGAPVTPPQPQYQPQPGEQFQPQQQPYPQPQPQVAPPQPQVPQPQVPQAPPVAPQPQQPYPQPQVPQQQAVQVPPMQVPGYNAPPPVPQQPPADGQAPAQPSEEPF